MCVVLKKITQIWMELKLQMGFKRDLNTTEIKKIMTKRMEMCLKHFLCRYVFVWLINLSYKMLYFIER